MPKQARLAERSAERENKAFETESARVVIIVLGVNASDFPKRYVTES